MAADDQDRPGRQKAAPARRAGGEKRCEYVRVAAGIVAQVDDEARHWLGIEHGPQLRVELREGQVRPLAFMDECAGFPAAKNDDQVHAMTQALLRLMRTNGGPRRTWIG